MPKEPVRVHTVPGQHEAEIGRTALDPVPDTVTAPRRRDEALRRLRLAREALAAEAAGIRGIETSRDDRWSVIHVLAHVGKDNGGHFTHVYDVLERGLKELEPFEDREALLRKAVAAALAQVDGAIAFAARLSPHQLCMSARRSGRDHYVVAFVEAAADHLETHVGQLREMRRSLDQARERRAASLPR